MKSLVIGAALALAMGGVAFADNFIVVRSSDPAIARNSTYTSGQTVSVARGASLTVLNSAGAVSTLTSRSGTITMPGSASSADVSRQAAMRAILERPAARRTFGAMRGGARQVGDCPAAADLKTLDDILKADADECNDAAEEAMNAYVSRNGAK